MNTLATLKRDTNGYLCDLNDWTPEIAVELAAEDNLSLNDHHWLLIHFFREFYLNYQTTPGMRACTIHLKQHIDASLCNSLYLQELFSKGPAKQISKLAGLPKPIRCI